MHVIAKLEITVWHCPGKIYIYIYIYIEREREKNRAHCTTRFARFARQLRRKIICVTKDYISKCIAIAVQLTAVRKW